jgi:Uma2 family endonuclease
VAKTLTIEQFKRLPQPEDHRAELDEGELIHIAFPNPRHNRLVFQITLLLYKFVFKNNLGEVFPSDTGYVLGSGTLRGPDVSFITADRAGARSKPQYSGGAGSCD